MKKKFSFLILALLVPLLSLSSTEPAFATTNATTGNVSSEYTQNPYNGCAGAGFDMTVTRSLDANGNYVYAMSGQWRGDYSGWIAASQSNITVATTTLGGNYGRDTVYMQLLVNQSSPHRSVAGLVISACKGSLVLPATNISNTGVLSNAFLYVPDLFDCIPSFSGTNYVTFTTPGTCTYTVPSNAGSITSYLWGAGGADGSVDTAGIGGGGGYTTGTIAANPGDTLLITVGGGGTTGAYQGGGGGRSGVTYGGAEILTAGGGGGAGAISYEAGGGGGGTSGQTAESVSGNFGGGGGTQNAGGAAGASGAVAGSYHQGGNGQGSAYLGAGGYPSGGDGHDVSGAGGGGGGDGYFGGGGGAGGPDGAGGGGGSGYVGGIVINGSTIASTGQSPAQTSNSFYQSGTGTGGSTGSNGGNGEVVIVSNPPPTCTISFSPSSIVSGSSTTLTWTTTNIPQWFNINGVGQMPTTTASFATGNFPVSPLSTTDFSCTVGDFHGNQYTTPASLTVIQQPMCTLAVSPSAILRGQSATLTYSSANVNSFAINPSIGATTQNATATATVSPYNSTSYTGTVQYSFTTPVYGTPKQTVLSTVSSMIMNNSWATVGSGPNAMAFDASGYLYVVNYYSGTISKITSNGTVTTFASGLSNPDGLVFNPSNGNLYATNYGTYGGSVSKVTIPGGTVTAFASGGFYGSQGITFDPTDGNLYVANYNDYSASYVSKVTSVGAVSTFSSGLPATAACGIVYSPFDGDLYVGDASTIQKITVPGGVHSTFASGFSGGYDCLSLAFDSSGNLYVSDANANTVSKVTPGGTVSTIVSSGLSAPDGLAFDSSGNLYVSNFGSGTITKITFPITTTWTVPADWNSASNTIEVIGGGGGGLSASSGTLVGVGGGGGAYAKSTNVTLTPGTLYYNIGAGGVANSAGGTTWINTTGSNSAPTSAGQGVLAAGGGIGTLSSTGGQGGQASASYGNMTTSGGNGGMGSSADGSGGGGAAGPYGAGANGGSPAASTGAGGGGGSSGGAAGANASGSTGGAGGKGPFGAGGGSAGGGAGASGGGGGGGTYGGVVAGGNGGVGTDWASSYGAGGGGGGGSWGNGVGNGGPGGLYGGGGGGASSNGRTNGTGAAGAQGIIVITYTPVTTSTTTLNAQCTVPANATSSVTVTCAQTTTYACTDVETISQTSTSSSCAVTTNSSFASCTPPGFCNKGGSTCYYTAPDFVPNGSQSGNLNLHPSLIPKGGNIQVFWNVQPGSAESCTITGTNGDSWSGLSSGASGLLSRAINQQTTYTLSCLNDDGVTYTTETQTVNVVPTYRER